MHEGRVKTVLEKDQATQQTIMSAALVADGVVVRA